jgi:hypothetical protein
MTPTDRTEVREMIHGILSGWQAGTTAQNDITNAGLKDIKDHLAKLNGSVLEHAKIIAANLPHTISHCPQTETIKEIRDKVVTINAVEKSNDINWGRWVQIIGIAITLIMVYFGYRNLVAKDKEILTRQDELGKPFITNSRGEPLAFKDTTRIYYWPLDSSYMFIIKKVKNN